MHPFFQYPVGELPPRPEQLKLFARVQEISREGYNEEDEVAFVSFEAVDAEALLGLPLDLAAPFDWYYYFPDWRYYFLKGLGYERARGNYHKHRLYIVETELPLNQLEGYEPPLGMSSDWHENWFFMSLKHGEGVDLYRAMFSEADPGWSLAAPPTVIKGSAAKILDDIYNLDESFDADPQDLDLYLQKISDLDHFVVFDIGQGAAAALCNTHGQALAYFDVGCGYKRNSRTRPPVIGFCHCCDPMVILSHWDADHWCGALQDTRLMKRHWIAPRQWMGPVNSAFALNIRHSGGSLSLVNSPWHTRWRKGSQDYEIGRCTSKAKKNRNGSGIALRATENAVDCSWLFMGDAGYQQLPFGIPENLSAIVVPHHGAEMGAASNRAIPAPGKQEYRRLIYSFGAGNAHGKTGVSHPLNSAVAAHYRKGWDHGTWKSAMAGHNTAGGDILATAIHPTTHLEGAVIGWDFAPSLPTGCPTCGGMPVSQC